MLWLVTCMVVVGWWRRYCVGSWLLWSSWAELLLWSATFWAGWVSGGFGWYEILGFGLPGWVFRVGFVESVVGVGLVGFRIQLLSVLVVEVMTFGFV